MKHIARPGSPIAGWSIRKRLIALVLLLLTVIGAIIYLSLASAANQKNRALVDNIAGRQPVLVHRYLEETLLLSEGFRADPAGTGQALIATGDALLQGGPVLAVQGNDEQVTIAAATDPTVRAKLIEEARLVHQLTAVGEQILTETPGSPAYRSDVARAEKLANHRRHCRGAELHVGAQPPDRAPATPRRRRRARPRSRRHQTALRRYRQR